MIPLSDPDIERQRAPLVTIALIVANVLVFVYQWRLDSLESFEFIYKFGAIPAEILGSTILDVVPVLIGQEIKIVDVATPAPVWTTMFTSMFMHGGFFHLGGNMVYLWVFGNRLEDRFGHLGYLAFYLVAGVAAVLAQSAVTSSSTTPIVGASGAIAGILGAYILLYPFSRVTTLILVGIIVVLRIPAVILLGVWALLQLFNGLGSIGPEVTTTGVAYFAHLGGFALGLGVVTLYYMSSLIMFAGEALPSVAKQIFGGFWRRKPKGLQHWTSVSCPKCGSDGLDFIDLPVRKWVCRRCGEKFR